MPSPPRRPPMADTAASTAAGSAASATRGRRPGALSLLARQFWYQNLLFWRNPFSAFFTIAFPLMFLLLAAIVTLLVGIVSFCALGLALAAVCPNGEAAPAMANFTWLPVAFVSSIFFPLDTAPKWLQSLGGIFPVKHFAEAMQATFSPFTTGNGFRWHDLGVIALWALGGTIVAVRRFQWEPRAAGGGRRRRRQSLRTGEE